LLNGTDSELSDSSEDEDNDETTNFEPNQISDNDSSEDEEDDVSLINLANNAANAPPPDGNVNNANNVLNDECTDGENKTLPELNQMLMQTLQFHLMKMYLHSVTLTSFSRKKL